MAEETNNLPPTDPNQLDITDTKEDIKDDKDTETKTTKPETDFTPFEESEGDKTDSDTEKSTSSSKGVEIDEDDRKVMQSVINEESKDVKDDVAGLKVDMKVNSFLTDEKNEVYKPFAEKIREYAKSPAAKNLKAEAIARLAVDPREMIAKGAEAERKASKESRDSVSPGGAVRVKEGSSDLPDAWKETKEDFNKTIQKAKYGR